MKPLSPLRLLLLPILCLAALAGSAAGEEPEELNPLSLTKYLDPLPIPGAMPQAAPNHYEIGMWQTQQQLHSQLPLTTVWGYGTSEATAGYPAATIEAVRGVPITVRWTNHLPMTHLLDYAIDPTLHMAMPMAGVPAVAHLHGGEVEPQSDGGPDAWFTQGFAEKGSGWTQEVYNYPNDQNAATLWYHDHALGMTRLNVYAGLAGFYLLRDPGNEPEGLPSGPYEVPIVIQDRDFTTDAQFLYPNEGDNDEHPVWVPEFFGDFILVNGKVWPYLEVEPRKYRFRFLDGSNSRFYSLALADRLTSAPGPAFYQIGSDGGYLSQPVVLNDPADLRSPRLLMAPGERADVIIDFSGLTAGTELLLRNNAKSPFPRGEAPNPQTTGQIMLFRVLPPAAADDAMIPELTPITPLANPVLTRTLTLNEIMGGEGPLEAILNNLVWDADATEVPTVGTTEMWEIVNMTGDTHPIHLHLVQFQMLNRQKINVKRYQRAFEDVNGMEPGTEYTPVPVEPYLKGGTFLPDPNETGWKDTFRMNPGEVTRVLVRFTSQDGSPYSFDATAEPGYVWHCHIIEHEDNEMMRPYRLVNPPPPSEALVATVTPELLNPSAGASGITLRFRLHEAGPATLGVYNISGQLVRQLVDAEMVPGLQTVTWDGRNGAGEMSASGIYFMRLETPRGTATGRLHLAR